MCTYLLKWEVWGFHNGPSSTGVQGNTYEPNKAVIGVSNIALSSPASVTGAECADKTRSRVTPNPANTINTVRGKINSG